MNEQKVHKLVGMGLSFLMVLLLLIFIDNADYTEFNELNQKLDEQFEKYDNVSDEYNKKLDEMYNMIQTSFDELKSSDIPDSSPVVSEEVVDDIIPFPTLETFYNVMINTDGLGEAEIAAIKEQWNDHRMHVYLTYTVSESFTEKPLIYFEYDINHGERYCANLAYSVAVGKWKLVGWKIT